MEVAGLCSARFSLSSSSSSFKSNSNPKIFINSETPISFYQPTTLSTFISSKKLSLRNLSCPKGYYSPFSSVESEEYIVEPTTEVKFETSLNLPGCSEPLSLIGAGYREKVFAIIGVKVYAVGLYTNLSIVESLSDWKGRPEADYQEDASFFKSIYQAPAEKALKIVLVRDIDGKTFWDALNDGISPRIKTKTLVDESALAKFRNVFQGRPLNKGTCVFLTWTGSSKMLVSITSDGSPSTVDATIESTNINMALYDIFFGDAPVSPSLKAMVCNDLAKILK
ncbi:Fatty-acid-binding protein 3 [Ranunculus cassubicifolius]